MVSGPLDFIYQAVTFFLGYVYWGCVAWIFILAAMEFLRLLAGATVEWGSEGTGRWRVPPL